jgi:tubulin delta
MIFVNCGQCGNQLGYELLGSLWDHLEDSNDENEVYFRTTKRDKKYARVVCLDTEPKVVSQCLAQSSVSDQRWMFDPNNIVYRHGGAGNNWATGYHMYSGDFRESAMDAVRREIEQCDGIKTLIVSHSVAGGTGSGLGTHVTEDIADEFGDITLFNIAVTPYHFGEVVVQHYNSVLCLSKVANASDGVLIFENEVAQDLCKRMKGIERPTLYDINKLIAANITPMFLPKYDTEIINGVRTCQRTKSYFNDDIVHLCSHPGYKFLDVKNTPQTSHDSVDFTYDSWFSIVNTLTKMQIKGRACERGLGSVNTEILAKNGIETSKSIGSVLTLHGPDAAAAALQCVHSTTSPQSSQQLQFRIPFSDAIINENQVKFCYSPHVTNQYQRSACLVSNSQSILPMLQRAASKAAQLYQAGAFIHQYKQCGLDNDSFLDAFTEIGQVIANYKSL